VICAEKYKFFKKQTAKDALRRLRRVVPRASMYECPTCGFWHLSSWSKELARSVHR